MSITQIKNFLLLAVFANILGSCQHENLVETKPAANTYPITQPILLDTVFAREYVADIQSMQHVEIRAQIKGFLEKIHVDEGQEVSKGQLLFTLSSKVIREELRQAQAMLKSAIAESKVCEVETENTRTLVEKNIVGKPELDMAVAKLEAAQAKIEEAQAAVSALELNLTFAEIRAPFPGVINREPLKVGSLVNEGDLLTSISSIGDMYAYFSVSEKEYLDLQKRKDSSWKRNVALQLAGGEMHPHKGSVETVETVVDKNTGSLAFRARFSNPDQVLRHGASGKVLVFDDLKNALVIPQKCGFDVQDKTYVYVQNKDQIVERKAITIKQRLGQLYVIESGLTIEDRVIYEGIQSVRDGEKIESQHIPMSQVMQMLVGK